ncbi:ABC transporter substrate-binding protein [Planctomycetota bacterium]
MKYRNIICFAVLVAIVLVAFGCGRNSSDYDPNDMVLRHVLYTKITSLDPGSIRDVYSITIVSQICEPLYQYHFLKRPYEIVSLIAEDMPEISDDNLTYTIKIQKGVYFQDDECFPDGKGRELKAQDFVFAFKRVANIKYLSQNWAIFEDRIVGLDEFREYTKDFDSEAEVDYSRQIEGLQTPDDYTLVVKLKRPWPQFIGTALTDGVTSPIAKEAVDYYGEDIISHPVGTGPFMLKKWQRGSYVEMVRNPNFRGELYPNEGQEGDAEAGYLDDAGKPMPFADRVIWTIIEESQPAWLEFMQGNLDASSIPKDNYSEVFTDNRELDPKMEQLNIKLDTFSDPSTFWIGFNLEDPVLGNNKPLRLAINRAIDREEYNELFSNGRNEVAHGFVAPIMDSYDPNIKEKGFARYDPNEAIELLKEAENVHGGQIPTLTLAMPSTDSVTVQYGQFLKRQFDAIGLDVEMEYTDWPTYLSKLNTKSAQMFTSGVSASITDAEDFLGLFYSEYEAPGPNKFNYSNPKFDELYQRATIMFDSPERRELYRELELIVLEDCPAAFTAHRVAYVLSHDWYLNYKPHAFAYNTSKYRRIDMAKRADYQNLLKTVK